METVLLNEITCTQICRAKFSLGTAKQLAFEGGKFQFDIIHLTEILNTSSQYSAKLQKPSIS